MVAVVHAMPLVVKIGVVGTGFTGEPFDEFRTNRGRQLRTGDISAAEVEDLVGVGVGEVHQLVGQFIVILQGVHEGDRLQAVLQRSVQGQPQELGVTGGHGVVVSRSVDEVVG